MESSDKFPLPTINLLGPNCNGNNEAVENVTVLEQTRVRRLFTEGQLYAFTASYFTTWLGVGSSMYYAFLNGGPVAYLFNYIIVLVGVSAQAASLAELASIQPVAGAQYHWTWQFSPPNSRRMLTWLQGWTTWCGYIAGLTSVLNSNVVILEAVVSMNSPSFVTTGWRTFVIIAAVVVFCAVINVWFFWMVPWFEVMTGVLNIVYFFVFLVTLWVLAPRNHLDFIMERASFSGWDNYFISWNVGVLSQVWLFVGFEAIVHMSEETKQAKMAIPRSMFWSVVINGFFGLVMLITVLVCMPPDLEEVINASSPFVTIVQYATGSNTIATALMSGQLIMGISCNLATFSSATRLTWAWARDGGLPRMFGHVDGRHRVPIRAVLLTSFIVLLLALLNLGSGTYTALGAITSLCVLASYGSYIIIIAVTLISRFSKAGLQLGPWNLGRYGLAVNIFAMIYSCWMVVFLPFPSVLPVTAATMNWSLPAYATVMVMAIALWYMRAKKTWSGPDQRVVDHVLRQEAKMYSEIK